MQFLNFCFSEFSTLKILVVSKIIIKGRFYEHQQPAGPRRVLEPLALPVAGHPEGIEHGVGLGGQRGVCARQHPDTASGLGWDRPGPQALLLGRLGGGDCREWAGLLCRGPQPPSGSR